MHGSCVPVLKEHKMKIRELFEEETVATEPLTVPSGNKGIAVADVQKALLALGAATSQDLGNLGPKKDGVDGIQGPLTTAALEKFQSANKLPKSGRADNATITALNSALTAGGVVIVKSTPADVARNAMHGDSADAPTASGQSVVIGNEKRIGGTISWRTNNPGNISHGDLAKEFGAIGTWKNANGDTQQQTTGIAIMPSLEAGIKLQMALWRRPKYNNYSIGHGVSRWTGNNQHPNSQYARDLARAAGVTPNTRVSELTDDQLKNMVKQQAQWEGFKVGRIEPADTGAIA